MKISERLNQAINQQIVLEMESAWAYLQMAGYFEQRSLPGMANWMRLQSEEERSHALKFFEHVHDRDGEVTLGGIPAPKADFGSVAEVFAHSLDQERRVTQAIEDLYQLCLQQGELASLPLLQWFLEEQVEEEASVSEILGQVEMIDEDGTALLLLDRELGQRTPEADEE